MDSLTELVKAEIKRQYGSIKEFSTRTGIPMSTLNTAFPKGIETSSYELVTRVCSILQIKRIYDDEITYVNRDFYDLVRELESLDEQGLATVRTLLTVEKNRCKDKPVVIGYRGAAHVEKTDEHLKNLIRAVLAEEKKRNQTKEQK